MRITPDTNVLLRAVLADDEAQGRAAIEVLESAESVAISVQSLCEFAWVLSRGYKLTRQDISEAIRRLVGTRNVVVDRPAVDAGLEILEAGGDFADGAISHEGRWLGGETFVSFDRQAVRLLESKGRAAQRLG